jgi:hypothetical protein
MKIGPDPVEGIEMEWVTIDFEASCLPRHGRSYPIEVGICGPLGTCSWLIRPVAEWRHWDWTEEAFALHGIKRDQLDAQGLEPRHVLDEIRLAVGPARVVADSAIDREWWQTLLDAAQPATAPAAITHFRIEQVTDVFAELGASHEQILVAQQRADRFCPERHRAASDARWLFTLLLTLSEQIEADRHKPARKSFPGWATQEAYVGSLGQYRSLGSTSVTLPS